jgi:hypothetical protein
VNEPEVGINGAGAGRQPVAETGMHSVGLVGELVAAVVDQDLERLDGVSRSSPWSHNVTGAYVAARVHVVSRLCVGPDHTIRGHVGSEAWWLPCEDEGAILGRCGEVGPGDGRRVAHNLGALDEVLDSLLRAQAGQRREAVGRDQMDVGKLRS